MARPAEVQVKGARELRKGLRDVADGLTDLKSANQKVGQIVGNEASSTAPRRSGRLASQWRAGAAASRAAVTFRAPYANAVHWGTGPRPGRRGPHNIRRNPFAWDAAVNTQPDWLPAYETEIQRLLDRVRGASTQ